MCFLALWHVPTFPQPPYCIFISGQYNTSGLHITFYIFYYNLLQIIINYNIYLIYYYYYICTLHIIINDMTIKNLYEFVSKDISVLYLSF